MTTLINEQPTDKPTTWNAASSDAVNTIYLYLYSSGNWSSDYKNIRDCFDAYELESSDLHSLSGFWINAKGQIDEEKFWTALGAQALGWGKRQDYDVSVDELHTTLCRKQRDYGHQNIARFGMTGLIIRCHDKIARLENLLANNKAPGNESIYDTVMDIAGYSAIGIMWARNEFLLPLEEK